MRWRRDPAWTCPGPSPPPGNLRTMVAANQRPRRLLSSWPNASSRPTGCCLPLLALPPLGLARLCLARRLLLSRESRRRRLRAPRRRASGRRRHRGSCRHALAMLRQRNQGLGSRRGTAGRGGEPMAQRPKPPRALVPGGGGGAGREGQAVCAAMAGQGTTRLRRAQIARGRGHPTRRKGTPEWGPLAGVRRKRVRPSHEAPPRRSQPRSVLAMASARRCGLLVVVGLRAVHLALAGNWVWVAALAPGLGPGLFACA